MWGRVVEFMVAVWLLMSPFIFESQKDSQVLWTDIGAALTICLLSGLSYWKPMRFAYLGNLFLALGLLVLGRFFSGEMPPPAAQQNHIFVGFFLLMIAIIPNEASRPPNPWRQPTPDNS